MIAVLVAAFVLSGAAGLIYESIWTRYLGLFVGHSAYAQIIVLVIFLGGMSVGAHVAGRRSRSLTTPLLWYAGIEFVVGLLALAFHDAFGAVTAFAYDAILPHTGGLALTVVKWSLAGAMILPQSVLLGATFPLMSAGVIRIAGAEDRPGRSLALLYFANSIGAAAGVLIAGFVLLQLVGLPGTLMTAAFANIVVAILVGLIARADERRREAAMAAMAAPMADAGTDAGAPVVAPVPPVPSGPASTTSEATGPEWQPLLGVAFGTAVASFIYEIAWIRMLSLVLGSATHSFELMLSAFILGLALGALWIRGRADAIAAPVRFLGVVQWVMGLLAVATLPVYVHSFDWMATLLNTVQLNQNGYRVFTLSKYVVALLVMLPATFCAGMTLPLITRVLMQGGAGERAIGAVYAWNTFGSIAGVVLAGLVLMPVLGLKLLLVTGAVVDIALGVWLVARSSPRGADAGGDRARLRPAGGLGLAAALVGTAAAIVLVAMLARFDLARLSGGVYRHGVVSTESDYQFLFYKDGRTASVSLRRSTDGFITLATNGKPDASMDRAFLEPAPGSDLVQLRRDLATQFLLPLITLAHVPRAADAAVIGHGSGMSSHVLLGSPHVRQVVTIEIEPEMINASRGFLPANRRVFDDRRSMFVIDDAKSYFASTGRRFDLILSEPSNPWVSGVSGLFTLEFYRRISRQLSDSGVFGQWLHLYELNDGLAMSVFAAINAAFPAWDIFFTSNADVLVVASNRPLPAPAWDVVAYPGIAADLKRVVPLSPDQLETLRLGDRAALRPVVMARGAANSDYFPVLDLGAERLRFLREYATGFTGLSEGRFDVVAALADRRADFGRSAVAAIPDVPRSAARAVSATLHAMRTLPPGLAAQLKHTDESRNAAYRLDQLERMADGGQAPTDWHRWMEHVVQADEDLHAGTAGVVDSAFYARMRRYAARAGAPAEVRAGLDFLHGIGAWNWPEVIAAAAVLEKSTDGRAWIPEVLLRNCVVVADLRLAKYEAAREALRTFARRTNSDSFRERLLASYLIFADSTLRAKMGWK